MSPFFLTGAVLCVAGVAFVATGLYYLYTTKDQPTDELKQKHAEKTNMFILLTGLSFLLGTLLIGGAYLSCALSLHKLKYPASKGG